MWNIKGKEVRMGRISR